MNDSKPNKGYKVLIVLIYTVVFILGMMLVLKLFVFDKVKEKATEIALEKVLEQEASTENPYLQNESVKKLLENMETEDKETAEEIITNTVSASDIPKLSGYVAKKDTASLKKYVQENLSEEDMGKLQGLYDKYKDQIQIQK
ncbi:MAG: hypothetical protein UH963_02920 [Agathobacter sp.]|nr:hypothetical protein [Agathobacter sp.]